MRNSKGLIALCVIAIGCGDNTSVMEPEVIEPTEQEILWSDFQSMTTAEDAQRVLDRMKQMRKEAMATLHTQQVAYDPCGDLGAEAAFALGNWLILSEGAIATFAAGGYNPTNPVFLTAAATAAFAYGYWTYKNGLYEDCHMGWTGTGASRVW